MGGMLEFPSVMLRRVAEVGLIEFIAEQIEANLAEPGAEWDPEFVGTLLPLMEIFNRYFDAEVRGFEHMPDAGPMLLVGNHSGGVIVPDTVAFISAWYRERGLDDQLVGLAFDAMFAIPGVRNLMRRLGQIPANPEDTDAALAAGRAVLVYPGGSHEAFRPWTDRNRIDFGGRKGFVRVALRNQVPLVPVVGHGGHENIVVLTRGEWFARTIGLERLRLRAAPLIWQIPWGISLPLLPGIPMPAKVTVEVCEPLDWSEFGPDDAEDPSVVDRCYEEVTDRMQAVLTRLAEERPSPLLSRLASLLPRYSAG
ncbi:MAG: acyltransferase family protein [Deltaproteobacteria bacterium]|nr:acyltransferase family protein [Deltaproteobacteria bacterium]MBW2400456.1 acyltransferase family protein [Deltaproteobacteria bacterium]